MELTPFQNPPDSTVHSPTGNSGEDPESPSINVHPQVQLKENNTNRTLLHEPEAVPTEMQTTPPANCDTEPPLLPRRSARERKQPKRLIESDWAGNIKSFNRH